MKELVYIEWTDHHTFQHNEWHSWDDLNGLLEPVVVKSVGWKIHEDKDHIVIAAHVCDPAETATGEMSIIKKVIVKREKLKVK